MAQEKGFVTEDLETVLTIELSNGSQIECLLDTGFNGFYYCRENLLKIIR